MTEADVFDGIVGLLGVYSIALLGILLLMRRVEKS